MLFPINTPWLISAYQLNTIPEVGIFPDIPNDESETASSVLFSPLFLSTPLLVCSRVHRPELSSHTDYNHKFQPKINPFLEIKFLSQIKTKSCFFVTKNKKRFSEETELRKSLTCQNLSRFE